MNTPSPRSATPCTARAVLIVLDGVGIGELPDAAQYGDAGSHTLGHIAEVVDRLKLPHLCGLGLANIAPLAGLAPVAVPTAGYGKLAEASAGKDSTTGHWELAGLVTRQPFPRYPQGFPPDLIARFRDATGCRGILGNVAASGTALVQALGAEHLRTGFPILYTSADSVFQIAAHEDVIPLNRLYEICRCARETVCVGEHRVSRVIARPFAGQPGRFSRTAHRRDFSVAPPGPTLLDVLSDAGVPTTTIGKTDDLFAGRGIRSALHPRSNTEGVQQLHAQLEIQPAGLIFATLVDFDTLYGHRNDPQGFARALEAFDAALPALLGALQPADLLVITADHGNDPVTPSTDHSREYVPVLCYRKDGPGGTNLGTRSSFADVAKTIAAHLAVENSLAGTSFLRP